MELLLIFLIPLILISFVFYKIQYLLYKSKNKFIKHLPTLAIVVYIVMYIWFYFDVYLDIWPGNTYMVLTAGITNAVLLFGLLGMIIGKFFAKRKFKSKNKELLDNPSLPYTQK